MGGGGRASNSKCGAAGAECSAGNDIQREGGGAKEGGGGLVHEQEQGGGGPDQGQCSVVQGPGGGASNSKCAAGESLHCGHPVSHITLQQAGRPGEARPD